MPLTEWTSLPNLHPAVVHFPIALLVVAFAFDVAALALTRRVWLDTAGTILWVLGSGGAVAAYLTGRRAGDGVGLTAPEVEAAMAHHSDLAWWTLLGSAAVAALRGVVWWMARADDGIRRRPTRAGILALSLGLVVLVLVTADRGGALVYRHGVSVAGVAHPSIASPGTAPAPLSRHADRLIRFETGGLVWSPSPDDGMALGDLVDVVAEPAGAVAALDPAETSGAGLALRINGRSILLLPGEFGDVQVKAVLALSDFRGTAGVVHHYRDALSYGSFEVAAASSRLVHRRGAEPDVLDEAAGVGPQAVVTIAVSSIGSHLKGFVGSETVAHGHVTAPAPGRTGLLLEGDGVVHIHELRVDRAESP